MLTVYTCIVEQHDLRLVLLAAIVCGLASFTAIRLLQHVRKTVGVMHNVWLGVAALSSGFGIWATHFIAMLAYSPALPTGYNIVLTLLSLVAAIVITGIGLSTCVEALPGARWIGGGVVGGGIAAMHYTGMAAFEVAGHVVWNPAMVVASIALGAAFAAVAMPLGLRDSSRRMTLFGGFLLTLAICSHHFTAMAAAAIVPDPTIAVSAMAIPASWLAVGVSFASVTILLLTVTGLWLDIRDRRRAEQEESRMRGLANAAVEGLIVCDGATIVTANSSFERLAGVEADTAWTKPVASFLPDAEARAALVEAPGTPVETVLQQRDGTMVPVEVIQRTIDFAGRSHRALAIRDLRARKRAESRIHYLAHYDSLTGLPNRNLFGAKLDEEIRTHGMTGRKLAVMCLDLDRFKEVNDLFGHSAGDQLLQTFAECVARVLNNHQTIARLGGDEFAIVVPQLHDGAQAGQLAEAIFDAVATQNRGNKSSALISASIGIAIFPDDGLDRAALLNQADTALYRAKAEGRGAYRFFEAAMGQQVRDRRLLEHDLRHALARGELRLVYQPQAKMVTSEIIGFEALLRWRQPGRGEVSPAVFIPIAEETALILQIGEWVLRTACEEAASWPQPLGIAVNVSTMQLHNSGFPQLVHEVLLRTGLSPHRLELEITETALIHNRDLALGTLRRLKALGIRVAMDDFGTGYSSLSNLRAFPFDKIKIDGSFIHCVNSNAQAATIVRAVLGLGRGLGLHVLAEGVETPGEMEFLGRESCNEAQGLLLGRPEPIESYRHLTHAGSVSRDKTASAEQLQKAS